VCPDRVTNWSRMWGCCGWARIGGVNTVHTAIRAGGRVIRILT
jgi:hypothetical protein